VNKLNDQAVFHLAYGLRENNVTKNRISNVNHHFLTCFIRY